MTKNIYNKNKKLILLYIIEKTVQINNGAVL